MYESFFILHQSVQFNKYNKINLLYHEYLSGIQFAFNIYFYII